MPYKSPEQRKAYLKERREWLHEHHFCIDCKQQDAYTLVGKHRCFECHEKARIRRGGKEIKKQYRVENELCVRCGKPNNTEYMVCKECHKQYFLMSAKSHRNHGEGRKTDHSKNPPFPRWEWVDQGFCYLCGDEQQEGYKVCRRCRERLIMQRRKQAEDGLDEIIRESIDRLFRQMHISKIEKQQENERAVENFRRCITEVKR